MCSDRDARMLVANANLQRMGMDSLVKLGSRRVFSLGLRVRVLDRSIYYRSSLNGKFEIWGIIRGV